jgi:hypothetical protein
MNVHTDMMSQICFASYMLCKGAGIAQPHIEWVPRALSPEVKRLGREGDHKPPTSATVKNTWIYTSTPPYVFIG